MLWFECVDTPYNGVGKWGPQEVICSGQLCPDGCVSVVNAGAGRFSWVGCSESRLGPLLALAPCSLALLPSAFHHRVRQDEGCRCSTLSDFLTSRTVSPINFRSSEITYSQVFSYGSRKRTKIHHNFHIREVYKSQAYPSLPVRVPSLRRRTQSYGEVWRRDFVSIFWFLAEWCGWHAARVNLAHECEPCSPVD